MFTPAHRRIGIAFRSMLAEQVFVGPVSVSATDKVVVCILLSKVIFKESLESNAAGHIELTLLGSEWCGIGSGVDRSVELRIGLDELHAGHVRTHRLQVILLNTVDQVAEIERLKVGWARRGRCGWHLHVRISLCRSSVENFEWILNRLKIIGRRRWKIVRRDLLSWRVHRLKVLVTLLGIVVVGRRSSVLGARRWLSWLGYRRSERRRRSCAWQVDCRTWYGYIGTFVGVSWLLSCRSNVGRRRRPKAIRWIEHPTWSRTVSRRPMLVSRHREQERLTSCLD